METYTVSQLVKDLRFEGFLLVRSSDQRTGSNGSRYLDMNLADRTGEINCKMWDGNVAPPPVGSVIKVRGLVQEYNGAFNCEWNACVPLRRKIMWIFASWCPVRRKSQRTCTRRLWKPLPVSSGRIYASW